MDATPCRIEPADAGIRLDVWLMRRLALSRAQARRLLDRGQVIVNGRVMREGDKSRSMSVGDDVVVSAFVPPALQWPIAQAELVVPVLAEGDGWVVFDKPAGMAVHPLSPDERGTLLNAAMAIYPQIPGVGEGGLRSGVVHRLDVETSGCLVVATRQPAWHQLTAAFRDHTARKRYLAVVHGTLRGEGRDEVMLHVAQHHPARVRVLTADEAVLARGARRCHHTWRSLDVRGGNTLVEINLGTGFLHQIRAIFAHRGHPVLGDAVYGDAASAARLMLHACELDAGLAHAASPIPAAFGADRLS